MVPPNGTGQSGSCIQGGSWSGYHAITLPSIVPPDLSQVFALVTPGCGSSLDAFTAEASHEIVEAAVDPVPGLGWIDHSTAGFLGLDFGALYTQGEASDICDSIGPARPPLPTLGRIGGGLYAVDYYWSNVDNACVPMPHTVTITATGAPSSLRPTFDGSPVPLGYSTTVADGTSHDIDFPAVFVDSPGSRYGTSFTSGPRLISANATFTAAYTHQFLLQTAVVGYPISPAQAGLPPTEWLDAGSTVSINASALVSVPPDRLRFDHWEGDAGGGSPSLSFVLNSPKTIVAGYVLQHQLTVQTAGLGANVTRVYNGGAPLGQATDAGPVSVWLDDGTSLSLSVDNAVSSADGTQYFFGSFSPAPPAVLTGPFTTTATYRAMASVLSGGISGPGAGGLTNSYQHQFAAVEADFAASGQRDRRPDELHRPRGGPVGQEADRCAGRGAAAGRSRRLPQRPLHGRLQRPALERPGGCRHGVLRQPRHRSGEHADRPLLKHGTGDAGSALAPSGVTLRAGAACRRWRGRRRVAVRRRCIRR